MFWFWRILTFWRLIFLLIIWYFLVYPWLTNTYNQVAATYWWMRP